MSDPLPPLNPNRSLRRAGNILSPDGKLTKDFASFGYGSGDSSEASSPTRLSFARTNGLGATIKRRLEDFRVQSRIGRSKSLSDAPAGGSQSTQNKHRPHSLILTTHPSRPGRLSCSISAAISEAMPAQCAPAVPPSAIAGETVIGNVMVPQLLQQGTPMTKVSPKTHKKVVFRLDADLGQMVWESKQQKISEITAHFLTQYCLFTCDDSTY